MGILNVLNELRLLGITIELAGTQLKLQAPRTALSPELMRSIQENRGEIVRFLEENALVKGTSTIQPVPQQPWYEVSHGQRRLWMAHQLAADERTYNIPRSYKLTGTLRVDALEWAFAELVARHESLRTTFILVDGELKQKVSGSGENKFVIARTDVSNDPDPEAKAQAIGQAEAATAFDLGEGPLLKTRLVRTAPDTHFFFLTLHHLISDDWSMGILIREVLTLYNAFGKSPVNPLPPLSIQYRDYAAWQMNQRDGEQGQKQRQYWLDQFREPNSCLGLLADYPRTEVNANAGSSTMVWIDAALTRQVLDVCQRFGVSVFVMLLTLSKALLYRYTYQTDITLGTTVAGRQHVELENQIGFYVSMLPLRTRFAPGDTFEGLLGKVKETAISAFAYQAYPFDQLVEELDPAPDGGRTPFIDVVVQLIDRKQSSGTVHFADLAVASCDRPGSVSQFDLSFNFYEHPDQIALNIEFVHHLFRQESIWILGERLLALLRAVLNNPHGRLDDFDMAIAYEQADSELNISDEFAF
ncbi:MAG: hypothetical protein ICV83_11010 [Cytophagales bacterium]|nr:hypothetical protein [Cytophagales bacterium]